MSQDSLRARVLASVAAESTSPTRSGLRRRSAMLAAAYAAVVSLVMVRSGFGRPASTWGFVLGQLVALALSGWWLVAPIPTLARSRTLVRRSAGLALAIVLALLFVTAGGSETASHVGCVGVELGAGAAMFVAVLIGLRPVDPSAPRTTGLALGVFVLVASLLVVTLDCPATASMHVLMAHLGPGAAFVALGALAGRRWLGVPRRT